MNEQTKQDVIETIKSYLPDSAKILLLSLSGSRAFGWGLTNQDYDIHGIFACENYWDYVHAGKHMFDINLYEFHHTLSDINYQHFEAFMNWSNPIFVANGFDYEGLMSFCTLEGVKGKCGDIDTQINRFNYDKAARTALHTYRILMVPIHFIDTKKFVLDIFELNKSYNFTELEKLKQVYNTHSRQFNIEQVKTDIDYLLNLYKQKISDCTIKVDTEKAKTWFNTQISLNFTVPKNSNEI
jgi:hypothetical protein